MKIPKTLLVFLFLFVSTTILAQNKVIDSLNNELRIHKENDSLKVDILNMLAFNYRRHNISIAEEKSIAANTLAKELAYEEGFAKSILMYSKIHILKGEYNEALKDALTSLQLYEDKKGDNYKGLLESFTTLGMIYNYQNDSNTSIEYFNKSLSLAENKGDLEAQASSLNNIGITYYIKGEYEKAVGFFKNSITIDEELGDNIKTLPTLNNIAAIYSIQGRYTEALEYYNKILPLYRQDNQKDRIASTLHNIGIIYSNIEQHNKAYTYFEESLQIFREIGLKLKIAKSLNSIGSVYVDLKEYQKGLTYLNESLSINKEINNSDLMIANFNSIGKAHINLKEPKRALNSFKSSLTASNSVNDKRNIGGSHINLAEVYCILENYTKAFYHAKEGKKIADDLEMLSEQKQANYLLSKIYENKGIYKKALENHKKYKALNDSLFNKKNIEKITQLEYEYKYKQALDSASTRELKLTKTVTATNKDLEESQRNLLKGVIAFLIIALVLGTIIFFLKLRNEKAKTQNIVIEQKLLRSQMTPHFIFNSLSVLQGMILNKEREKSISYLSKFSKLLRTTLESSRHKVVPLSEELSAMDSYMDLQNLDVKPPYNYKLSVDSSIDKSTLKIPPMLIQPFIENAIEHAFPNKKGDKEIKINLALSREHKLVCTITDNGIGINLGLQKTKKNKNSLATTITSERLKMLSKDFKMKGSITIEDRQKYNEQGTIVTLVIPCKLDNVV